jgi:hypothetical protein
MDAGRGGRGGGGRSGGRGDGRGGRGGGRDGSAAITVSGTPAELAEQLEVLRGEAIRAKRSGDFAGARAAFAKVRAIETHLQALGQPEASSVVAMPRNGVLGTPLAEEGFVLVDRTQVGANSYILRFELPEDRCVCVVLVLCRVSA